MGLTRALSPREATPIPLPPKGGSPPEVEYGCSSHSGRRTFITRTARRVSQVGGSLRDVQELAGPTSLAMTQRDIEGDTEAKRKLVALL